ncbi:TetR/AcrR family transcriptional regulator [uncultured Actinomyces sp.]|jgi:transcriptional regulator, tetR family|uniref:TetR/AcrR family transcriptional regulator n=1 Tax=uncultured Actinomyces sp. TaxID=249061 RepID=UPI0028E53189|nr:TetR/AcrR family transcriptional regulator [uncultured Actinomyces sp.]
MYLRNLDKHGRDAEKNLDLRIRKTRRAIRSGLVKACEAKPYEHVSVADICRVSMVSRTTFYDHYTGKDALLAEVVAFLLEDITPALEGLWCGEGGDSRAVARHLADIYARNGRALTTLLAIRVGGEGDLHERLRQTCRSVFADWAHGRIDDDVLPLASEVYASVVLTFVERSATKPLMDKELAAIDRARELFIEGFGAR